MPFRAARAPGRAARNFPASGPGFPRSGSRATGVIRDGRLAPSLVRAGGEIDLAIAPRLRRWLAAALEVHREVVLDVSEVTFMDCSGPGVLVQARNHDERYGGRLLLLGVGGPVAWLLKLTGRIGRLAADP
ncbi:STAS domain-containing protein [Kitasatospora sp. NPDC050463]|uniref:STAS domain-containing protein n=1 Tax=Kitasatospora sp. NPDC050463 TaxID=3155786 RepID=UPI0033F5BCFA